MNLKRTLFVGGFAGVLLLAACNGDSTEDTSTEESAEESTGETTDGEAVTYAGTNGEYDFVSFTPVEVPSVDAEGNETTAQAVAIEFEFTNTSEDRTSTPSEAFSLDLAVRQVSDAGDAATDNLTMDLEDEGEFADGKAAAMEMIEPGESTTAVVAYGPLDPEAATHLQARENPIEETESLDHEIDIDLAAEESE